jgi:hypothetical protein
MPGSRVIRQAQSANGTTWTPPAVLATAPHGGFRPVAVARNAAALMTAWFSGHEDRTRDPLSLIQSTPTAVVDWQYLY